MSSAKSRTVIQGWTPLWEDRAVVAVDARNFGSLDSASMQAVNVGIQVLLKEAMEEIGLTTEWEHREFGQHTGDGYVAGLPPQCLPGIIGCFPASLHRALLGWQHDHPGELPLQLRVSVHRGPLPASGLGVPMVETHRLLDDRSVRTLLARSDPRITTLAMIISQRVYEDVFNSGCATGGTIAANFALQLAKVKTFSQPAWLHVPGLDWGLADPGMFDTSDTPASQESASTMENGSGTAKVSFHQHGTGPTWMAQNQDFRGSDFRTLLSTPKMTD